MLPPAYKKAIYEIHGLFLYMKTKGGQKITLQEVYKYLRTIKLDDLLRLFYARRKIVDSDLKYPFMRYFCSHTKELCELLFE
jgi:hypothetical protein